MADYIANITIDQVIDALAAYLAPFAPNTTIIRGQVNRTPMPKGSLIVLTEILSVDLSVPLTDHDPSLQLSAILAPTQIDIQADFYGPNSGDYIKSAKSAFRTGYGFDAFPSEIKPLYISDARQSPLTTGEQQYETRWTCTVSIQYNPSTTFPQQSATSLTVDVLNVERTYPA